MKNKSPQSSFKSRTAGRMAAVQALFQLEQTNAETPTIVAEFLEHRLKTMKPKANAAFFAALVEGAWESHPQSDELITESLKEGWHLDRLDSVTRAILRAALYELRATTTPPAVIMNEYLNVTRSFFDTTEISFVNGILNAVAQKIRPNDSLASKPIFEPPSEDCGGIMHSTKEPESS